MSHTRLFVGNLPENVSSNDLQEAFSSFGEIINVDLKSKSNSESDQKRFAFITLSGTHYDVESCIKHFSSEDFAGNRLYVTRARESFLERLQRERNEAQRKEADKNNPPEELPKKNPILKLGDKLNPRKRKDNHQINDQGKKVKVLDNYEKKNNYDAEFQNEEGNKKNEDKIFQKDQKKTDSDKKRMESLKKKRQEFKQKQMIIKSGLFGVDKVPNKKVKFSDDEDSKEHKSMNGYKNDESTKSNNTKNSLFKDDESDDGVNFEIKKQFEGKKGQKVLDLQSRYKSDKRFTLDERFIEDGNSDDEGQEDGPDDNERVDLGEVDEKRKQLNILQDVLGVEIKSKHSSETDSRKIKSKLGMLRFDPSQPEHAKFLAPVESAKDEQTKKSKKKKKDNKEDQETVNVEPEIEKVQVSKEQFYKVSDTLKETLEQPSSFSLRSLFGQSEDKNDKETTEDNNYISMTKAKETKVKNPLDPSGKNPFVYDSSDSEDEEPQIEEKTDLQNAQPTETKAVWKENLFFTKLDNRLIDGLAFFNKPTDNDLHKERRELKSVMKKRIYNKERKNQMFQKKIGGRRKSMSKRVTE